jgi:hypothetical protein
MRALDRLIDLLPIPALLAVAAVVAAAWTINLLKAYPTYAQVLNDKHFQCVCVLVVASFIVYLILGRVDPFSDKERGIVIAFFDGDASGNVRRQTIETLRNGLRSNASFSDARVAEVEVPLSDEEAARLLEERRATGVVAGSVVVDKLVWYRMYWRNQPPVSISINDFPNISAFSERFFAQFAASKVGDPIRSAVAIPDSYVERAQKLAVVIGNSRYSGNAGDLRGSEHDAKLFASTLARYDVDVTLVLNGDRDQIYAAFRNVFDKAVLKRSIIYIYYSGHGDPRQPAGIIPVDDPSRPIRLSEVLESDHTARDSEIFVFLDTIVGSLDDMNAPNVSVLAAGQLGQMVMDGPSGGAFTNALVHYLETREKDAGTVISFDDLARSVTFAVANATDNENLPLSISVARRSFGIVPK